MKRVAIVGFGFMGITHTINILRNREVELVAIVDKYPENIRQKLNEQIGNFSTGSIDLDAISNIKIYTDLKECLMAESPDACVIAVHTDLHHELTQLALNAGVNVFLEKPFSLSVKECSEMVGLARSKGLILMIGHVVRFMPAYKQLKTWKDTNEFGKLQFLSLSRFSGLPAWGQWKDKRKNFGSSGGALFDLVIHDIDYAQWVLGVPDQISSYTLPGELSVHDYLNAIWKYDSGFTLKIEGGNIFHTGFPFQAGFSAKFEKASILYSSSAPEFIKVATNEGITNFPAGDANEGFSAEIDYFLNCIKNKTQPELCTAESAMLTIDICHRHII